MNNPGLGERIENDARVIENEKHSDERDKVKEDEQLFWLRGMSLLPHSVWTTRKEVHLLSAVVCLLLYMYS